MLDYGCRIFDLGRIFESRPDFLVLAGFPYRGFSVSGFRYRMIDGAFSISGAGTVAAVESA